MCTNWNGGMFQHCSSVRKQKPSLIQHAIQLDHLRSEGFDTIFQKSPKTCKNIYQGPVTSRKAINQFKLEPSLISTEKTHLHSNLSTCNQCIYSYNFIIPKIQVIHIFFLYSIWTSNLKHIHVLAGPTARLHQSHGIGLATPWPDSRLHNSCDPKRFWRCCPLQDARYGYGRFSWNMHLVNSIGLGYPRWWSYAPKTTHEFWSDIMHKETVEPASWMWKKDTHRNIIIICWQYVGIDYVLFILAWE